METLDLIQGSDSWKEIRGKYLTASEAPIIMGASPHVKRDELMRMKYTGDKQQFDRWFQLNVLDKGHEVEAKAREIVEDRIGEDLYPVTGVNHVDGLDLLASFDGMTMLEDQSWECKQFNKELYAIVESDGELEGKHFWQLEHQCLVSGLPFVMFTCSDGTEEKTDSMVYHSQTERREQLIHGWKIFMEDVANYVHQEEVVQPQGKTPETLPTLLVEVAGGIRKSNLPEFREHALAVFASINTDLNSDQDFADADVTVKWCSGIEEKLELTKSHVLSQTQDIEQLFIAIDEMKEAARKTRLSLSNQIDTRKKAIRAEIVSDTQQKWIDHLATITNNLDGYSLPKISIDIAGSMKGKRTITTLRSAANDELARAKIEANRIAEQVRGNIKLLDDLAEEHQFLFNDKNQLIQKDADSLTAIVKLRIAEYDQEQKKIQEAKELKEKQEKERQEAEAARLLEEEQKAQAAELVTEEEQQEEVNPVEPSKPETHAQKIINTLNDSPAKGSRFASSSSTRQQVIPPQKIPTQDEIVQVLAKHYEVHETTVIRWLSELKLQAA